ncbi:hypothetical protein M501DRAFT_990011 [Patellaria atrata CBS 101060]|uniref:Uncharacterized protein n=1 Tax=Patellaria atrata CBS 101060 TaxID=1346257 RepID=A0A9P4SFS2_9PEZI|nr:hypothetical protein M501DRAFT_990011 [Patellaria atrata CBS 101060]
MAAVLDTVQGLASNVVGKGKNILDSIFPPEKRAEVLTKLQTFALNNPKLAAFLLTNIALTGFPIFLFLVFTITVFVFSLLTSLLVALLAALLFTAAMVLVALFVVLPTVFMTTMAATFVFLWGLGGYYLLKWLNKDELGGAPEGGAIGDKLNSLTRGRLDFLMGGLREQQSGKDGEKAGAEKKTNGEKGEKGEKGGVEQVDGAVNGVKKNVPGGKNVPDTKNATDQVEKTANTGDVQKKVEGVPRKLGTAKGAVGGVTGLT